MQFTKLSNELITDNKIDAYQFRIYTYLISLYNEEKQCSFPCMETIASKLGIGLTTVKKGIKRLSELGYITIEKKKNINRGNFNIYKNLKHLIGKVVKAKAKTNSNTFSSKRCNNNNNANNNNNNKIKYVNVEKIGFNNFTPREYDYEELEKRLLGWVDDWNQSDDNKSDSVTLTDILSKI